MSMPTEPSSAPLSPRAAATGAAVSRRAFLQSAGAVVAPWAAADAVAAGGNGAGTSAAAVADAPAAVVQTVTAPSSVTLHVNGQPHTLQLEPRVTLLDALRNQLGLMGTKKGCDRGQCGACTVMVDGRRINACLTLAVMNQGTEITTVEGLGTAEALHAVQAAFLEHDAFQCGYCTPGQICSAVALLGPTERGTASAVTPDVRKSVAELSDDEIRERMSGNICRCGAYPNIVAAVRAVAAGSHA